MSHFLPLFHWPSKISDSISEMKYNLTFSKGGKTGSIPNRQIHTVHTPWKTCIGTFLHSSVIQASCRSFVLSKCYFKLPIFLKCRTPLPIVGEHSLLNVACVSKSEKIFYLSFCFSGPDFT